MTKLSPEAVAHLKEAPVSAAGILRRAYEGKAPPRAAIKAFCLSCVGYLRADVTACSAHACPLWRYRPYQDASGLAEGASPGPQDATP